MRKAVCGSTPQSPLKPGKSQPKRLPMCDINCDTGRFHPFFPLSSASGNPFTPTNLYQKPAFDGENRSPMHRSPVDKQRKRQEESDCEKVRKVYKQELESREKLVFSIMTTKESLETQVNTSLIRIAEQEVEIKNLRRIVQEVTEALERCNIEKSDLMGEVHLLECEVDRVQYENSKLRKDIANREEVIRTMENDTQISQKLPVKEQFLVLESRLMEQILTKSNKFTVEIDVNFSETMGSNSENQREVTGEFANCTGKSIGVETGTYLTEEFSCEIGALQRNLQSVQLQAVAANTKFAEIATEFDELRKSVRDAAKNIPKRYRMPFQRLIGTNSV